MLKKIRATRPGWWPGLRRDLQVFAHLFPWRVTFILLAGIIITAYLFWLAHRVWEGRPIGPIKALFAIFNMIFLQLTFADMPSDDRLDIFPVIVPLIGLPLFSIFGLKMFNVIRIFFLRSERGQEQIQSLDTSRTKETLVRSTVDDHIVICGLGRIGYRVAQTLLGNYGQAIVGINDTQSPLVRDLLEAGIPVILGNSENETILRKAGIERAKAVVICTNEDWVNLGTAVLVRKLNPQARIILRLFEDDLMDEITVKFKVDVAISRSAVAATTFTYAAIGGEIVETFNLAGRDYVLAHVPLGPTSPMLGRTIGEVAEEQDVTVVCHNRGHTLTLEPDPATHLACYDALFVFTTTQEMIELIEYGVEHHLILASHRQEPILVCGLGHTGYRVASNLTNLGCQVVALDFEAGRLSTRLSEQGIPLKFGDMRWKSVLAEAGVSQAMAIVACTEDDMTNLQIALRARALNPTIRVVMRIFDAQLSEQLRQTFGANAMVYSTSALAAPTFVSAVLDRMNMRPVKVGETMQAVARLQVQAAGLNDVPIAKLHQEEDLTVLLHARGDQVDIPPHMETRLQVGDEIVVLATEDKLDSLNHRNKNSQSRLAGRVRE